MNRPDYLQDSDVVPTGFQVNRLMLPTHLCSCFHALVLFADLFHLTTAEERGLRSLGAISWDRAR
jgi:hypothetical protein